MDFVIFRSEICYFSYWKMLLNELLWQVWFPIAKHGLSHFSHRSLLLNELLWQTTHTFHWRLTSELLVTILNVDVYLISDVQHLYQSWNTHISVMETTNQTYPNFSRNIPHLIQWMSMYNNIKKVTLLVLDMYRVVFVHQCKHFVLNKIKYSSICRYRNKYSPLIAD